MKKFLMMSGLAATLVAIPVFAEARDACQQRNHERKVTGTLLGAAGGALIGSAVGGSTATVVGGLGGAAVGHEVGRINCNKRAYYRSAPTRSSHRSSASRSYRTAASDSCRYEDRSFYDDRGQLVRHSVRVCR